MNLKIRQEMFMAEVDVKIMNPYAIEQISVHIRAYISSHISTITDI